MTAALMEPGNLERELARKLEERAKSVIEARDRQEVATALGLATSGVDTLLWQTNWSLQRALRVLELLGAITETAADQFMADVVTGDVP
jgi:hypothetical protein